VSVSAPRDQDAGRLPPGTADFLRRLGHDLRSPLGVVSQALRELAGESVAPLTDDQRRLAALANRSLQRIGRIADTVSLLGDIDAAGVSFARQATDLVEVVRTAVAAAAALEPRREVAIECELPETPVVAMVDGAGLSRACAEVVINAIRHARRRVRVRLELADGEARAIVEDDGAGVAEDRLPALFARFSASSSQSGLGVGLSIAHDVLAAHGGRIAHDASTLAPGRPGTSGARFVLAVPLAAVG
jgi:two-component system sensor histidine kinase TctE